MTPVLTQMHGDAIRPRLFAEQRKGDTVRLDLLTMVEAVGTVAGLPHGGAMIHIDAEKNRGMSH
jgi:hypothetical protein